MAKLPLTLCQTYCTQFRYVVPCILLPTKCTMLLTCVPHLSLKQGARSVIGHFPIMTPNQRKLSNYLGQFMIFFFCVEKSKF